MFRLLYGSGSGRQLLLTAWSEVACTSATACPRVCVYVCCAVRVCRGAREVFTSLRHFREDLVRHPPDHFVCVPLVLDTLYNKVGGVTEQRGGSLPLGRGGHCHWAGGEEIGWGAGRQNLCTHRSRPVEEESTWLFLQFPHIDCSSLSEGCGF